jgi:sporulation protein YlmC with PRC-barrel domain
MKPRRLDLLRELLDHEVVDKDGRSCGMVDDLEFHAGDRGPELVALLVGPGAWAPRLPSLFALALQAVLGHGKVRVPWNQVGEIGETIRLQSTATELGLGRLDRKVGRWIARLPMS